MAALFNDDAGDQSSSYQNDITERKCLTCNRDLIAFYCENDDYVGCGSCIMRNHKHCQNVTDLLDNNIVKLPASELDKVRSDIYKFDEEIDETERHVGRNAHTCNGNKVKCLSDVKSFRAIIDKELDNLQSKIEQDIKDKYSNIEKRHQEASDLCRTTQTRNHQFKNELETTSERKHPARIYLVYRQAKHAMEKFRHELEKDTVDARMETYEFIANETLNTTMLSKVKSFGTIRIKVVGSEEAPNTESQVSESKHGSKAQVKYT